MELGNWKWGAFVAETPIFQQVRILSSPKIKIQRVMKKSIPIAAFSLMLFACSSGHKNSKGEVARSITPPKAISAAFVHNFPQVTNPSWDKEDGQYEANFTEGDQEMSATFDKDGQLLEKEIQLAVADLPASVTSYLNDHYPGVPIKEAAKIEMPDGTIRYEAEVKGKDLLFDENSNYLKKESD